MAWIESHQSLGTHRKVWELCHLLDIEDTQAIGLLHYLWWWALDNAPSGDLTGISPETIGIACHWNHPGRGKKRDSKRLFNALLTANFLQLNDNNVKIHDWEDYAGKLIKAREIDRIRHRLKPHVSNGTPTELHQNSEATVPNRTIIKEIYKEKGGRGNTSESEFLNYVEDMKGQFPELDCEVEFKRFTLYWSESGRKLKRPKTAWYNWLVKARQIKEEHQVVTPKARSAWD